MSLARHLTADYARFGSPHRRDSQSAHVAGAQVCGPASTIAPTITRGSAAGRCDEIHQRVVLLVATGG
jgi:hypothetical protein